MGSGRTTGRPRAQPDFGRSHRSHRSSCRIGTHVGGTPVIIVVGAGVAGLTAVEHLAARCSTAVNPATPAPTTIITGVPPTCVPMRQLLLWLRCDLPKSG